MLLAITFKGHPTVLCSTTLRAFTASPSPTTIIALLSFKTGPRTGVPYWVYLLSYHSARMCLTLSSSFVYYVIAGIEMVLMVQTFPPKEEARPVYVVPPDTDRVDPKVVSAAANVITVFSYV